MGAGIGKDCGATCPCGEACPLERALHLIGGKWKIRIICALNADGAARYNELKRKVAGINNTILAKSLRELEADGLVTRAQYNEVPARVEYAPTDLAAQLVPILGALGDWGRRLP